MLRTALFAIICATLAAPAVAAGPTVDIVLGEKADPLEKFAAEEMAGQLKKLFDADVRIGTTVPPGATNVILLGTPASHSAIKDLDLGESDIGEQVHLVKSIKLGNQTVLAVVGGSPRAALWATYELGWHHGIRYFLFGDLYPTNAPTFATDGMNVVIRPTVTKRTCEFQGTSPLGPESWGLDEFRKALGQLAKLKITSVRLHTPGWRNGVLFDGQRYAVDGDTVGRTAFRGAKIFDNPELAASSDRTVAGRKLAHDVEEEGRRLHFAMYIDTAERNGPKRIGQSVLPDVAANPRTETCFGNRDFFNVAINNAGDQALMMSVLGRGAMEVHRPFLELKKEIILPVCGEGVDDRVVKAFDYCNSATAAGLQKFATLGVPGPELIVQFYDGPEFPDTLKEARTNYLNAMNEMYRANTRAREGGRAFTLYYARRFEFGFEFINALESTWNAGIAKRKGDKDTQIAELEKAIDSVTNACNAMAAVARSPSDRGVIAVMNEYGYRPLLKLLEEADTAN